MNKLNDIAVIMSVYFKDKPEDLSIAVNSISDYITSVDVSKVKHLFSYDIQRKWNT